MISMAEVKLRVANGLDLTGLDNSFVGYRQRIIYNNMTRHGEAGQGKTKTKNILGRTPWNYATIRMNA